MPDFGICLTSFCSLKILGYISSSVKRSKEISSYHLPAAYYGPGTIHSILSVLIWINTDINGMSHGCFLKDQPLKDNPEEGV